MTKYVISNLRGVIGRIVGELPLADEGGFVFNFPEPKHNQTQEPTSPALPTISVATTTIRFFRMGYDFLVREETACYLLARPETRLTGGAVFLRTREPQREAVFSARIGADGVVELVDAAGFRDDGRPVTVARLHPEFGGAEVAFYLRQKRKAAAALE